VLVRHHGRVQTVRLEDLWNRVVDRDGEWEEGVAEPSALEVLSWDPAAQEPLMLPVMCLTRRDYDGDVIEVGTKMGRRVTTTVDHPFFVSDGTDAEPEIRLAGELTQSHWLPLAMEHGPEHRGVAVGSMLDAVEAAELRPEQLIVRPRREYIDAVVASPIGARRAAFQRHGDAAARTGEVLKTARNGAEVRSELTIDAHFWRVVGLYLAEGCTSFDAKNTGRVIWSFHPTKEQHLVDDVVAYWLRQGVRARVSRRKTSCVVTVQSRLVATWWTRSFGLGRNGYEQRLPDLIWEQPARMKWALLSGLFEGDGSWSLINGGPSVTIELGTVSDELADGVLRLLGEVGIVASRRIGRTKKSTKDTHWIRISGAEQVERAIELVPARDRAGALASVARQAKRIAPTGYRRFDDGTAWVRISGLERRRFRGPVYSMEVVGTHSFVASGSIVVHNCFPKDVTALKQLAGNSGYHFQLLNAVIEVNELQKRRVMGKLHKHLGTLVGKRVALLGLAFKPNTDDMREATSLVLSARLQADGASVVAYDPVAEEEARKLIGGIDFAPSAADCVDGADAIVLVTEWSEFKELDWGDVADRMRGTLVIDGRNALDAAAVWAAGLTYEGIGRS
jgi:UDPglucose 6-dehydrogenase